MPRTSRREERGYALLTAGACAIAMVAMLGLSVDLGRLYISRNESQAYVDSAAMRAALELDGTLTGVTRAQDTLATNRNRWHMGNSTFTGAVMEFSTAQTGPWQTNPGSATGVRFVRVRASADPPLYFIPIVVNATRGRVDAMAIAGQVPQNGYKEGAFPFSPIAHDRTDPVNFGLTRGERYTLRWASNPRLNINTCDGDNVQSIIDIADASGSERGYIEETSSAIIREAIEGGYQTRPLEVGMTVDMTGGTKETQRDSIIARAFQDNNASARTYTEYVAEGNGNGRRLVAVPINTWQPDYEIVGFAAFFILEQNEYNHGGNQPFCAEYVGPYVQGSRHMGAGTGGSYAVRLVQ